MTAFFRVRNFEKFQHYKDRAPTWIKLYNSTLDDYDFATLPDASKAHLICIWLLASRSENKLPTDPAWIQGRIGAKETVDLEVLFESGFLEEWADEKPKKSSATKQRSNTLAQPEQPAIPETETEKKEVVVVAPDRAEFLRVGELVLKELKIDPARWMGNFGLVEAWLRDGMDAELDILPACRLALAQLGEAPKSLKYITPIIQKIHRDRLSPMPAFTAGAGHGKRTDSVIEAGRQVAERLENLASLQRPGTA